MDMDVFNAAARRVHAAELEQEAIRQERSVLDKRQTENWNELNAANKALSDIVGHAVKSAGAM